MPLNRSLVDSDDSVDVLYGVLSALMLVLPEAVRETLPADLLQANGYCHIAALHTLLDWLTLKRWVCFVGTRG